jgi:hypothetical protein
VSVGTVAHVSIYGSAMLMKYIPQPDNNVLTQTIKFVCIKLLHVSIRSGQHPTSGLHIKKTSCIILLKFIILLWLQYVTDYA